MATVGREVCFIAPTKENPRNTEGAFIRLSDGRIMFAYSRFIGESHDNSDAEIYAIFSRDEGETWGEGRTLLKKREGELNLMSVSIMRMPDGSVGLFYLRKATGESGRVNCAVYLSRSYDECESFSDPRACIDEEGYFVCNNDRIIMTSRGRIIIPVAYHEAGRDASTVRFYLSDDGGESFRRSKDTLALPFKNSSTGLQEPGIVELPDGRLWAWARTGHGCQFEAFSSDGDEWSSVEPNEYFSSPCSPMSVKRLSGGGLLAVFNPIPMYNTRYTAPEGVALDTLSPRFDPKHKFNAYSGRTPLVCAVSHGGVESFPSRLLAIEDDPSYSCCYTALHSEGDLLLAAYMRYNFVDDNGMVGVRIKKIVGITSFVF